MEKSGPAKADAWMTPVVAKPQCLKQFLRSGQYSDLVIRCGDHTWNVHKVVVCSQCEFMQNACSKGFQEEQSGMIELDHDHADAIDAMLEWAYSGDYSQPANAEDAGDANKLLGWLLFNARVLILAEKYLIEDLRKLAWMNATMWADDYAVNRASDAAKLTEIGAVVYAGTPDDAGHPLRGFVLHQASKNIKALLACDDFRDFLKGGTAFSVDLVRHLAETDARPRLDGTDDSDDGNWNSDNDSSKLTPSEAYLDWFEE